MRVSAFHPRKTHGIAALAAPSGSGEVRGGVGEFQGGLGEFLLWGGGHKVHPIWTKKACRTVRDTYFHKYSGPRLDNLLSNDFLVGSWSVGTQKQ